MTPNPLEEVSVPGTVLQLGLVLAAFLMWRHAGERERAIRWITGTGFWLSIALIAVHDLFSALLVPTSSYAPASTPSTSVTTWVGIGAFVAGGCALALIIFGELDYRDHTYTEGAVLIYAIFAYWVMGCELYLLGKSPSDSTTDGAIHDSHTVLLWFALVIAGPTAFLVGKFAFDRHQERRKVSRPRPKA